MSADWHKVIDETDFPEDDRLTAVVNGWNLYILRAEGEYHALNDRCTHQASRLSTGRVRRGAVMCPLHGARFEIKTGRCLGGAYPDLRQFDVKVEDGALHVCVPDEKPSMGDLPTGAP